MVYSAVLRRSAQKLKWHAPGWSNRGVEAALARFRARGREMAGWVVTFTCPRVDLLFSKQILQCGKVQRLVIHMDDARVRREGRTRAR